jgi:hypothetical protein
VAGRITADAIVTDVSGENSVAMSVSSSARVSEFLPFSKA